MDDATVNMTPDNRPFGIDNYKIEQQHTPEEVLAFCQQSYKYAKKCAEDEIHQEIAYCRDLISAFSAKNFVDDNGDALNVLNRNQFTDARRFKGSMCSRKTKQIARKLTNHRPKAHVTIEMPDKNDDMYAAIQKKLDKWGGIEAYRDKLQHIYDDWYDTNEINQFNFTAVKCAHDEGTAIIAVTWDQSLRGGDGDVRLDLIAADNFFPEPGPKYINDLQYAWIRKNRELSRAVREYGEVVLEAAKYYETGQRGESESGSETSAQVLRVTIIDGIIRDETCVYTAADREGNIKEISEEKVNRLIEEANENRESGTREIDYHDLGITKKQIYPYGRHIAWLGNTLLVDEPNQYDFTPWEKYTPNPQEWSFWGEPTVREMAPVEENFDKFVQKVIHNCKLNGAGRTFIPGEIYDDIDAQLRETFGDDVISVKSTTPLGNAIHHSPAQNVSEDVKSVINLLRGLMDEISGIQSEGQVAANVRSGRQLIANQESSREYHQQSGAFFENVFQKLSIKIMWLLQKYAQAGREYSFYPKNGMAVVEKMPMDLSEMELTVKITVEKGSTIPKDPPTIANEALALNERDPLVFNTPWLIKQLQLDSDPTLMSPQVQYDRMVRDAIQLLKDGTSPQELVQSGRVPMQIMQQIITQAQAQNEPPAGASPMAQQVMQAGRQDVANQRAAISGNQ